MTMSMNRPRRPKVFIPTTNTSVASRDRATKIREPDPDGATTSSAATSLIQQIPRPIRSPVTMHGRAPLKMVRRQQPCRAVVHMLDHTHAATPSGMHRHFSLYVLPSKTQGFVRSPFSGNAIGSFRLARPTRADAQHRDRCDQARTAPSRYCI